MRMALRSVLPLVLAAAAFALARSEGAAPPSATADVDLEANDGTPALPRVLPPRKTPPAAVQPAPPSVPIAVTAGRPAVLATTTAPSAPPSVDLLAPPTVPVQWSRPAALAEQWSRPAARPATAAAIVRPEPAGYPAGLAPVPPAVHSAPTPVTAQAVSAPPPAPVRQTVAAMPPPAMTRPTLTPLPAQLPAPAKRVWPPAFVTKDAAEGEAKPVAYTEKVKTLEPIAEPVAVKADDLRQRVTTICGGDAKGVTVSKQANGFVVVRVRVRQAGGEQKVMDKVLKMPEMARPTVRLILDPGT